MLWTQFKTKLLNGLAILTMLLSIRILDKFLSLVENSTKNFIIRSFHYIFMESMRDPTKDPVIIWLGGGPGCSCLLGLIREIGPYIVMKEDLEGFKENPNSLHKIASVLYLEVPAGVGYST